MRFEIPYSPHTLDTFQAVARTPWSILFDSGYPTYAANEAVTDFWSAHPYEILIQEPSESLPAFIKRLQTALDQYPDPSPLACGYISYDAGLPSYDIPQSTGTSPQQPLFPLSVIALYTWWVKVDHAERTTQVHYTPRAPFQNSAQWHTWIQAQTPLQPNALSVPRLMAPIRSNLTFESYSEKFQSIQSHLRQGDVYQVNFTERFCAPMAGGHPFALYQNIRTQNPAPFSGYFHTPYGTLLSFSPECFLSVQNQTVSTHPIKGTAPRSPQPELDQKLSDELRLSPKNRAENVMIVDLMRNDLTHTAQIGSIQVDPLFAIESFPGVHHLISSVHSQLRDDKTLFDLIASVFPGGSITGAPKKRAMEIIAQLEPDPRSVYCGSLLALHPTERTLQANITIRTLLYQNDWLYFWGGGGITIRSEVQDEYEEIRHKIQFILKALGGFPT